MDGFKSSLNFLSGILKMPGFMFLFKEEIKANSASLREGRLAEDRNT